MNAQNTSKEVNDPLLQQAITEEVQISPYDPNWPKKYELERARLMQLFPTQLLAMEHVGSTAVPGLPAKPIIDILAQVPSLEVADQLLPQLCENGYSTSPEFNASLGDERWLMRQENGHRTHHLHLVLPSSETWDGKLRFRNLLRSDPKVRNAYAILKMKLAEEIGYDREAYSTAKRGFIESALERPIVGG